VKLPREEEGAAVVSTTWSSVAGSFWSAANGQIGAKNGGQWLNVEASGGGRTQIRLEEE